MSNLSRFSILPVLIAALLSFFALSLVFASASFAKSRYDGSLVTEGGQSVGEYKIAAGDSGHPIRARLQFERSGCYGTSPFYFSGFSARSKHGSKVLFEPDYTQTRGAALLSASLKLVFVKKSSGNGIEFRAGLFEGDLTCPKIYMYRAG